ncbi:LysM peptidoglycan-binding domain-containing protein [Alkalicoccus saliphilus]|uniref:LysM peptidoglycan-binding domain-containing protein n=1 Tax=Alkalicoccus saliphilus TaxID=200989 RepID=UPI00135C0053|nr:LysM peptidoglycan-binding domain-containing protein [Alkalicoccus saliphilus]
MGVKLLKIMLAFILIFVAAFTFSPQSAEAADSKFITKANTSQKVVALTFDDGADGTNINSILDTLDLYDVKATFFLTGTGLKDHPQDIKRIADEGHQLGNHSYSHPDFRTLTASQIKSELDKTEALAKQETGESTKPIFRAPYGYTNDAVLAAVGTAGYTHTIQWNIDTVDWRGVPKNEMVDKVISNVVPGSIVLMHTGEGASGTPYALPDMIQELDALGYEFVTVSELLNYHSEPPAGTTYTVQPGDTLYKIAQNHNMTVSELMELNNLSSTTLSVGQLLILSKEALPAPPSSGETYTVKPGDTLYRIAVNNNTTVQKLAEINNISNPAAISVGQVIILKEGAGEPPSTTPPSGDTYTVKPGDTLYRIAVNNNTTVQKLAEINNISNPAAISVGQVILLKEGAGEPPSTLPPSGTSYTIKPGDTLYSIALRNGTTVQKIAEHNNITDPSRINAGAVIVIP